jgi:very-short-patch-repair endonuclease
MGHLPQLTKEALEAVLAENPNSTWVELAAHFGCGASTIGRKLHKWGLRTKPWTERTHKASTREKIGTTRKVRGVARGSKNPNFGSKDRPWLEGARHPLRRWHKENPDFGDRQRGEANPVHKVAHLYEDPAYVARITRGLKAHVDQRRGSTYEQVYGPEKAAEYKDKLRQASPQRLAKFARKETAPERSVRELLEFLGVGFEQEYAIGHYTVDFFVPGHKLVVQADGDYWHAHPEVYGPGLTPLNDGQRKRKRLDASCDSFLRNGGYSVLRLWERDLRSDPAKCRERIFTLLRG